MKAEVYRRKDEILQKTTKMRSNLWNNVNNIFVFRKSINYTSLKKYCIKISMESVSQDIFLLNF